MSTRDLRDLHPQMYLRVKKLLEAMDRVLELSSDGWSVFVTDVWRDGAEQDKLKAEGKSKAGRGQSPHEVMKELETWVAGCHKDGEDRFWVPCALACDFAWRKAGVVRWDGPWNLLGAVAVEVAGLEWGGNWKNFVDRPHVQMPNWKDVARLVGWTAFEGG